MASSRAWPSIGNCGATSAAARPRSRRCATRTVNGARLYGFTRSGDARTRQARRSRRARRRSDGPDIRNSDNINMVMLNGHLYDAATLNEPRHRHPPAPALLLGAGRRRPGAAQTRAGERKATTRIETDHSVTLLAHLPLAIWGKDHGRKSRTACAKAGGKRRAAALRGAKVEPRFEGLVDRAALTFRSADHIVRVVNISSRGTMIETELEPRLGESVSIRFEGCSPIYAFVRWVREGRIGLNFGVRAHARLGHPDYVTPDLIRVHDHRLRHRARPVHGC